CPSTRSAMKAVRPPEGEGQQDKAREGYQLELDDGDEQLDRENEEGEDGDRPCEEKDANLREIVEQADRSDQILGSIEKRRAGVQAGCRHCAGLHELGHVHSAAGRLETEGREAVEDDRGEYGEIADDPGEGANVERLLDETLHNVLVGSPG